MRLIELFLWLMLLQNGLICIGSSSLLDKGPQPWVKFSNLSTIVETSSGVTPVMLNKVCTKCENGSSGDLEERNNNEFF